MPSLIMERFRPYNYMNNFCPSVDVVDSSPTLCRSNFKLERERGERVGAGRRFWSAGLKGPVKGCATV